jgi:hypothetical protein
MPITTQTQTDTIVYIYIYCTMNIALERRDGGRIITRKSYDHSGNNFLKRL